MFELSAKEMSTLKKKLDSVSSTSVHGVLFAQGCPNCNGQCKNGCGVTCVAILS